MRSNATTLSINVQCSYAAYHTLGLGNKARPGTAVKSKRPSRADDSGGRAGNRRRATLEGGMFVPGDLSDLWMAVCASSPPPLPLPPLPFRSLFLPHDIHCTGSSIKCALVQHQVRACSRNCPRTRIALLHYYSMNSIMVFAARFASMSTRARADSAADSAEGLHACQKYAHMAMLLCTYENALELWSS